MSSIWSKRKTFLTPKDRERIRRLADQTAKCIWATRNSCRNQCFSTLGLDQNVSKKGLSRRIRDCLVKKVPQNVSNKELSRRIRDCMVKKVPQNVSKKGLSRRIRDYMVKKVPGIVAFNPSLRVPRVSQSPKSSMSAADFESTAVNIAVQKKRSAYRNATRLCKKARNNLDDIAESSEVTQNTLIRLFQNISYDLEGGDEVEMKLEFMVILISNIVPDPNHHRLGEKVKKKLRLASNHSSKARRDISVLNDMIKIRFK